MSLHLPQKTGMGPARHTFWTCLAQDTVQSVQSRHEKAQLCTNRKHRCFANSVHLVMLILLAQPSTILISSSVPTVTFCHDLLQLLTQPAEVGKCRTWKGCSCHGLTGFLLIELEGDINSAPKPHHRFLVNLPGERAEPNAGALTKPAHLILLPLRRCS